MMLGPGGVPKLWSLRVLRLHVAIATCTQYCTLELIKNVGFRFHVFGLPVSIYTCTHHHRESDSVNYIDDAHVPLLVSLDGCLQLSGLINLVWLPYRRGKLEANK